MYIRTTCKNSDKINDKCRHMDFVVEWKRLHVYMCVYIFCTFLQENQIVSNI